MTIFQLLSRVFKFLEPVLKAVVPLIALILGAIADPTGAINSLVCRLIDFIAIPWPSTPESLKLANLLFPYPGSTILEYSLTEMVSLALQFLGIVLVIKLYKLIPFKAS